MLLKDHTVQFLEGGAGISIDIFYSMLCVSQNTNKHAAAIEKLPCITYEIIKQAASSRKLSQSDMDQ
jgi:hypothetical protein